MSHALEQLKAAPTGVICKSASIAPHFLLARLQRYSVQFVFQLVFPAYTLQLPSICVLPTAFKTFCSNKLGILTGTSWHFSDISSDISARPLPVLVTKEGIVSREDSFKSLHISRHFQDKTLNANKVMECIGEFHQGLLILFSIPNHLACKAARVQRSICLPVSLSRIHLTASLASLYLCPADCFQDILLEQAGNSHWNKLAFLRHIK